MRQYEFRGTLAGLWRLYLRLTLIRLVALLALALVLMPAAIGYFSDGVRVDHLAERTLKTILRFGDRLAGEVGIWAVLFSPLLVFFTAMIFAAVTYRAIALFRFRNTWVFGAPLDLDNPGCSASLQRFLWYGVLVPMTAGLALPWALAYSTRQRYELIIVPSRKGQHLHFCGSGWGVLGLSLLLPIAVALAPFTLMVSVASWESLRRRWELGNVLIPDASGDLHRLRYIGSLGADISLWLRNFALVVLTLGFYGAAARVRTWRHLTDACQVEGVPAEGASDPGKSEPPRGRSQAPALALDSPGSRASRVRAELTGATASRDSARSKRRLALVVLAAVLLVGVVAAVYRKGLPSTPRAIPTADGHWAWIPAYGRVYVDESAGLAWAPIDHESGEPGAVRGDWAFYRSAPPPSPAACCRFPFALANLDQLRALHLPSGIARAALSSSASETPRILVLDNHGALFDLVSREEVRAGGVVGDRRSAHCFCVATIADLREFKIDPVFLPGNGVVAPVQLSGKEPVYPRIALRARVQGTVEMEVLVLSDGHIGDITVTKGLPFGLEDAASECVRSRLYKPGTRAGDPVNVLIPVSVEFRLR